METRFEQEDSTVKLHDRVNSIQTREDLIAFIQALHADLRDDPDSWENPTLDRFLEALGAWMEDMDGYYDYAGRPRPERPDWRTFGDMLMAAKLYE